MSLWFYEQVAIRLKLAEHKAPARDTAVIVVHWRQWSRVEGCHAAPFMDK
jgi:hypothetical protein